MIHLVSGFIKAGLKVRRRTIAFVILFAAVAICLPVAAPAQGISAPPGLVTPAPPRQPISNPGAPNPAPSSNPICVRLESQLTALTQGSADPVRAEQIKRTEDAIAKQQADLDRTVAQAHKAGCAGQGFFAFFSALSPQCGPITSQIQQMRGNLDRMISDLEQLKNGNTGQEGQRRALIGQLAQNNCGAQYTAAANSWGGPQGFFDALFGGGTIVNPGGDGAPSGTYHTVCVRACDGFYFPISYSTVPSRFSDDAHACQRLCPAAEAELYSFHNPGEDMQQAMSISGQAYTALPNAFRYRKEIVAGCSCRRPGQSWADALKNADEFEHIRKRRHRRDRSERQGTLAAQTVRQAGDIDAAGRRRSQFSHSDDCGPCCNSEFRGWRQWQAYSAYCRAALPVVAIISSVGRVSRKA